jgi:hypothetical protein
MPIVIRSLARLTAALLIAAAAAAFAIGASLERRSETAEHHADRPAATSSHASPSKDTGNDSAPDGDQHSEGNASPPPAHDNGSDSGHEQGGHEGSTHEESTVPQHAERLFGINLESTALIAAVIVVSILLAAAVLTIAVPWLAWVIAAVMLAFTALDVREIIFQVTESRGGLAAVAGVVALLHLLAAFAAARVARSGPVQSGPVRRTGTTANQT